MKTETDLQNNFCIGTMIYHWFKINYDNSYYSMTRIRDTTKSQNPVKLFKLVIVCIITLTFITITVFCKLQYLPGYLIYTHL